MNNMVKLLYCFKCDELLREIGKNSNRDRGYCKKHKKFIKNIYKKCKF